MCVGLSLNVVPKPSSRVMVNCSPQRQQNVLVVSQPSSLVSTVTNTYTTTSSVSTVNVVECLTTISSVVTSIRGQHVSTITTAGVYIRMYRVIVYLHILIIHRLKLNFIIHVKFLLYELSSLLIHT